MLRAAVDLNARQETNAMMLVTLLVLAVALVIGIFIAGTVLSVLSQLLIGLIIGGIARWILPGSHPMGWFATSLCGIVGSLLGGMLAHHLFRVQGLRETALNVLCAMGVIWLLSRV